MKTKPIKLQEIEQYLDVIQQLIDVQKTNSPTFVIEYNDFKNDQIVTQQKFVAINTYQTSCSVSEEQIKDLKKVWDIDVLDLVKNALVNENVIAINKHCMANIGKLAKDKEISEYTLYDKFVVKLYSVLDKVLPKKFKLSKIEFKSNRQYIKKLKVRSVKEILDAILYASAKIARDGKLGYGNFAVCGPGVASLLERLAPYAYVSKYDKKGNGLMYTLGNIAGLTIYVDPYMLQSDTRVFIGRKNKNEESGLKLFLKDDDLNTKIVDDGHYSPRIITKMRYALVPVGESCKDQYRMITFKYNDKKIKFY